MGMRFPPAEAGVQPLLRPATSEDVDIIASIERAAFSDPWPAAAFASMLLAPHARIRVAEDAHGTLLGYCVLLLAADEGEIANIAVAPFAQRRGVAGALLDDALVAAAHADAVSVYLEVRVSNTAARALYDSRRFAPVGRRRAYYRNPLEDALVLRWSGTDRS